MDIKRSVVLIGGFLGNKTSLEHVALNVSRQLDSPDFDIFTFAEAMKDPERTARAIEKQYVITHSAGMLAVKTACEISGQPHRLTSFSPPVPRSIGQLIRKSATKVRQMHKITNAPYGAIKFYEKNSVAEAVRHPYANFKHLSSIATFDGLGFAEQLVASGAQVDLIRHEDDVFYPPTEQERARVSHSGVNTLYIEGVHDEFLLRPSGVLQRCLEVTSRDLQ